MKNGTRSTTLDLSGVFFASPEAAKRMIAAGNGEVIINLSSTAVYSAGLGMAHYVAAKHGVGSLTKSLAVELGKHGIRVLALAPTLVQTPGTDANTDDFRKYTGMDTENLAQMLSLGRVGVPDDVAWVALFCASDLAGGVHERRYAARRRWPNGDVAGVLSRSGG